jgi:hypothetical protein
MTIAPRTSAAAAMTLVSDSPERWIPFRGAGTFAGGATLRGRSGRTDGADGGRAVVRVGFDGGAPEGRRWASSAIRIGCIEGIRFGGGVEKAEGRIVGWVGLVPIVGMPRATHDSGQSKCSVFRARL